MVNPDSQKMGCVCWYVMWHLHLEAVECNVKPLELTGQSPQGARTKPVGGMIGLTALYSFMCPSTLPTVPSFAAMIVISTFPSYMSVFKMVSMSSMDNSTCKGDILKRRQKGQRHILLEGVKNKSSKAQRG